MTQNVRKYLFDILCAIKEVESVHLSEISTEADFESASSTVRRAVERELEIMGEAAYRLMQWGMN